MTTRSTKTRVRTTAARRIATLASSRPDLKRAPMTHHLISVLDTCFA